MIVIGATKRSQEEIFTKYQFSNLFAGILKEVRPCFDLRINMWHLIDQKLLQESPPCAELHAHRLFLKSDEEVLGSRNIYPNNLKKLDSSDCLGTVWLRVFPQPDHIIYELVDSMALDLESCNHVFAKVIGYQDCVGVLEEFSSPSFGGKKAMILIRNLKVIEKIEEMFLFDGSIQICCDQGALTSLHSLSVFMNGKSWYETQGATAKISKIAFKSLVQERESLFDYIVDRGGDRRVAQIKDYDQKVSVLRSLYLEEWQPSQEAYEKACHFLHFLQIKSLDDDLAYLQERYPSLQQLRKLLSTASSDCLTVGNFLRDLVRDEAKGAGVQHQLLHEVRDRLVSNKGSIFFQYVVDVLSTKSYSDPMFCALAFCILGKFCDSLQHLKISTKKASLIMYGLLKASDKERLRIAQEIGPIFERHVIFAREELENCLYFSVKICKHSSRKQRENYLRYLLETGILDEFLAPQMAIQYIARIPLNELSQICLDCLSIQCLPGETTLGHLIDSIGMGEASIEILDKILSGTRKYVSELFVRLSSKNFKSENTYALFMIAKYICEERTSFVLV